MAAGHAHTVTHRHTPPATHTRTHHAALPSHTLTMRLVVVALIDSLNRIIIRQSSHPIIMPPISVVARALGAARRRPALLLLAGCLAWPSVDVAADVTVPTQQLRHPRSVGGASGVPHFPPVQAAMNKSATSNSTPPVALSCRAGPVGYPGGARAVPGGTAHTNEEAFAVLRGDGSIVAWGDPTYGGSGAPAGPDFVAVYATRYAFAALRKDGTIAAWGSSVRGGSGAPAGSDFVAVYSTHTAFAALRKNGTIAVWGNSEEGGSRAPAGSDFVAVYSTHSAFAALRKDGTIAAWGAYGDHGSGVVPTTTPPRGAAALGEFQSDPAAPWRPRPKSRCHTPSKRSSPPPPAVPNVRHPKVGAVLGASPGTDDEERERARARARERVRRAV